MPELMYGLNSVVIGAILLVILVLSIEIGFRIGYRNRSTATDSSKIQINTLQASLLGFLALLLGFTFSLALQRHDSRNVAVVNEANAIGTAMLRVRLLTESARAEVDDLLRQYLDQRIRAGTISMDQSTERKAALDASNDIFDTVWDLTTRAARENPNPVTAGLLLQSLNEMIDSFSSRNAALERHVPELVLFLLLGTFLLTGSLVGFASGLSGERTSFAVYSLVILIVLLVFIIIDLDRPRRGLIEVPQTSLLELRGY